MSEGLHVSHLDFPSLIGREWLTTNGVGGYASSSIASLNTRKYHGLLVAAMTPPARRMVLLARVEETLWAEGQHYALGSAEYPGAIHPQGHLFLRAFSASPFPRWGYQTNGGTVEKSLRLLNNENTVVLTYTLLAGAKSLDMELRPMLALRPIHQLMQQWSGRLALDPRGEHHFRIPATARTPEIFFHGDGTFESAPDWYINNIYRRELERGYAGMEDLWSPGRMRFTLSPGQPVHFVCSTDPIDIDRVLEQADWQCTSAGFSVVPSQAGPTRPLGPTSPDAAYDALLAAAGQFIVATPPDGTTDKPSEKSVMCIGNYPWGSPSVRDALVGYSGLFLVPGRFGDARSLLLSLAALEVDGLLPTTFPEDGAAPLYCGADVSLWYINAVFSYFLYTCDVATLRRRLLDVVLRIIDRYRAGTDLGVTTDSEGLLLTGTSAGPTTWMDSQADDWVLTPRRGRPVELNALWYNAINVAAELSERYGSRDRAAELFNLAGLVKDAFNRRFWNESAGCCFDVVHDAGSDPAIRPNQLLALSLPYPVLSLERHTLVLGKVKQLLLTPRGVRTLSPTEPLYIGRYEGNVVSRERASHNGAAYPWLLGAYVTAVLRVRGRGAAGQSEARAALTGVLDYLTGDGLGQICELFDGDLPHRQGGAIASASAVGEIARAYVEELLDLRPAMPFSSTLATLDPITMPGPPPVQNPA